MNLNENQVTVLAFRLRPATDGRALSLVRPGRRPEQPAPKKFSRPLRGRNAHAPATPTRNADTKIHDHTTHPHTHHTHKRKEPKNQSKGKKQKGEEPKNQNKKKKSNNSPQREPLIQQEQTSMMIAFADRPGQGAQCDHPDSVSTANSQPTSV
jgi:hypothetical protein